MSSEHTVLNELLNKAIKLAKLAALNSETVQKLKEAQMFLKSGQPDKAKTAVMAAFESLPENTRELLGNLSPTQYRDIEQLISQMYQHPQTDQTDIQEEIDQQLNRSYQATQQGGSKVSYIYLLSALDKAGIPLEKTPRAFQKQLKSLINSMTKQMNRQMNSSGRQTGGALPVSLPVAAGVVGGIIVLVAILLLLTRKTETPHTGTYDSKLLSPVKSITPSQEHQTSEYTVGGPYGQIVALGQPSHQENVRSLGRILGRPKEPFRLKPALFRSSDDLPAPPFDPYYVLPPSPIVQVYREHNYSGMPTVPNK